MNIRNYIRQLADDYKEHSSREGKGDIFVG
jgi:hypothetical protein